MVRIHSPRPFLRNSRNSVCPVTRFLPQISIAEPSARRIKPPSRSELFEILDLHRIGTIRSRGLWAAKSYPFTRPDTNPPTPTRGSVDSSVDRVVVTMTSSRRSERIIGSDSTSRAAALLVGGEDRPIPFAVPRTRGRVSASIREPENRQVRLRPSLCQRVGTGHLRKTAHQVRRVSKSTLPPSDRRRDSVAPVRL